MNDSAPVNPLPTVDINDILTGYSKRIADEVTQRTLAEAARDTYARKVLELAEENASLQRTIDEYIAAQTQTADREN